MYFVITKDGDGYRGRAYGGNHELVWWTEGYAYKSSAINAIDMLKAGAVAAPIHDRT
jgi:uncharacterized protein YegP (UPF0339 family)